MANAIGTVLPRQQNRPDWVADATDIIIAIVSNESIIQIVFFILFLLLRLLTTVAKPSWFSWSYHLHPHNSIVNLTVWVVSQWITWLSGRRFESFFEKHTSAKPDCRINAAVRFCIILMMGKYPYPPVSTDVHFFTVLSDQSISAFMLCSSARCAADS